jgi:hypothetical protein
VTRFCQGYCCFGYDIQTLAAWRRIPTTTHASPIVLRTFTKGIDSDQSNGTIRQQRRLLEELMNFASNLVSVLEIGVFCCDQNGPPARREEEGYLNRYVTDEQRSRQPIFITTLSSGLNAKASTSSTSTALTPTC